MADVEDVAGLTDAAAELIERTEERQQCIEQALETIPPYDWNAVGRRYFEEVYRPLLSES